MIIKKKDSVITQDTHRTKSTTSFKARISIITPSLYYNMDEIDSMINQDLEISVDKLLTTIFQGIDISQ